MEQLRTYQDMPDIQKNRWKILMIIGSFTFMATLDGSIVGVALPVIASDLGVSISQVEWIATSYLMAICSFILLFGRLGDSLGKVKIFKLGIFIFILGSLLCGFGQSLLFIVIARIIQALGASMTMACNMAIITDVFPKMERGKALGLMGIFVALGSITGPGIGGILVSSLGWEYIFWVNVPVGLLVVFIGYRMLPQDLRTFKIKIDITGNLLFTIFIISLFSAMQLGQEIGYSNVWIITSFIVAIVSFVSFIVLESKIKNPMIELSIFKNSLFSLSVSIAFFVFLTNFIYQIIAPFYTQGILELSPHDSGLIMMIFPIAMAIAAPISGALSDKFNAEIITLIGLCVLLTANIGLSLISDDSTILYFCILTALLGIGNGIFQSPNNSLVMSSVANNQLSIASSINGLMRNVGMVVGISLGTSLLFITMSKEARHHVTDLVPGHPEIFMHGMHFTFTVAASICFVGIALTGYRLFSPKKSVKVQQ